MQRRVSHLLALATLALAAGSTNADVLWAGVGGGLNSTALFHASGSSLVVTLTNTSSADVVDPPGVLTAVFLNITGNTVTLTPQSAIVPAGSSVLFGPTGPNNSVGGEWAYKASPMTGFTQGISSAGLGIFGPGDVFPGSGNLQGPADPDGIEYGITSAGDDPTTGNAAVTGANALIKNAMVFTLSGLPTNFDLTRINAVRLQYGTDLTEPHLDATVPAPGAAMISAAGAMFGHRRRRR
jgi:hypothetical protein